MKQMQNKSPWWLEQGSEICPACGQTYVYQTEFRCSICNDAVCAMCVGESISMSFVCDPCTKTEED